MKVTKSKMLMIAKMRGIKVDKTLKKDNLIRILSQEDKILHTKSPFNSIIENIREKLAMLRSKISKLESNLNRRELYEAEKIKNLTHADIDMINEQLNRFEDDLLNKNRYFNHAIK